MNEISVEFESVADFDMWHALLKKRNGYPKHAYNLATGLRMDYAVENACLFFTSPQHSRVAATARRVPDDMLPGGLHSFGCFFYNYAKKRYEDGYAEEDKQDPEYNLLSGDDD